MAISAYFDGLQLHPLLKHLESFSSYVLRLAEARGIQLLHTLSALLWIPRATFTRLFDYPPLNFAMRSTRTHMTGEDLLAAIFYHLDKKFGRSTRPCSLAGSVRTRPRKETFLLLDWNQY
jgi:hypothetical protein